MELSSSKIISKTFALSCLVRIIGDLPSHYLYDLVKILEVVQSLGFEPNDYRLESFYDH